MATATKTRAASARKRATTPPRASYHHGDLRSALLRAAVEIIDQKGVAGFTMKLAADAAAVAVSAPYRHFVDREALLAAVAEAGFVELRTRLSSVQLATSSAAQLEALALAYVEFAREHRAEFRVMFEAGLDKARYPAMAAAGGGAFAILVETVDVLMGPKQEKTRATAAAALWSLIHGFAVLADDPMFLGLAPKGSLDKLLRGAIRQLVAGM